MEPAAARTRAVDVVDGPVVVATVRIDGDVPEAFVLDVLGRLRLAAGRLGWSVRPRDPDPALREVVTLAGLTLLLGVQPLGQAEDGEQAGVEEVVQPDEPVA